MSHFSVLSLLAIGLYALVMGACIVGAAIAWNRREARWHIVSWLTLAALFCGLIVSRYLGLEEVVRETMRQALRDGGFYYERRGIQSSIAGAMLLLAPAVAAVFFWRKFRRMRGRRERAVKVALLAGSGMVGLVCLRLISLHSFDVILFGPLKLNWFADIGASLAVILAAAYYMRLVLARR